MPSLPTNYNRLSQALRNLITLHDAPWRWKVGLQAALGMGIPFAVFTLVGYHREGLVASMGAFTALYFARLDLADRFRVLPVVALMFAASSLAGTLAASSDLFTTLMLIAVTSAITIFAMGTGLGPPGPMMFVLVAGVSSNMATSGSWDDAALGRLTIPALIGTGALAAYAVTVAPLIIPSVRRRSTPPIPLREAFRFDRWDITNRIIAYRVIISASIAAVIAVPAGFEHAYWVVMVAGVVLQVTNSLRRTILRVAHRMLGTIFGVGVFAVVALVRPEGIWLVVMLALLQGLIEVVVTRHYGLALIFMTPLSLTIATTNNAIPTSQIIMERVLDTLLGIVIALVVLFSSEWLINKGRDERGML